MPLSGKRLLVVNASEEVARLIAEAALARGAEALVCAGGRAALAEADARGAHAAIVDLPLRDVRGDAFLVALRDRGVPCVAVSGVLKGRRYAEMARQLGAIAFLEKPFDLEAAFRLLEGAVEPEIAPVPAEMPALTPLPAFPTERLEAATPTPTSTSTSTPTSTPTSTSTPNPAPAPTSTPTSIADEAVRRERSDAPASRSRRATPTPTPAPLSIDPPLDFDPEHPDFDSIVFSPARPALDEAPTGLPTSPLEGLSLPLPGQGATASAPAAADWPRLPEGDLASTRVARLLTALHAARATGGLTLAREGVKKLVLFERGRPVFAVSNVPAERFGARAVCDGIVSAARLQELLAESGGKTPAAEALVARGHIDPGQRARMVREQICEILWNAFDWRAGSYRFLASALSRRPPVAVDLFPGELVLEGLRRTATLEALRAELPPTLALAPAPDPAFDRSDLTLSTAEEVLLAHADGTKTVADLVLLSRLEERAALALLQGCREAGLLVEVERALAGTRRIGFM